MEAARILRNALLGSDLTRQKGHEAWYAYGVLLLAGGDIPAYREICNNMVARFRRRGVGDEVAVRLCLLTSDSGVPIPELRRLMPHVELMNPLGPFYCYFVVTNGLLESRAGRPAEAVRLLVSAETDRFPEVSTMRAAVMAMALHKQGDIEAAKAHASHARSVLDSLREDSSSPLPWADRLYTQILLKEVETLIGSPVTKESAQ